MSKLDDLLFSALKKIITRSPTRQELVKFERKKELLQRIRDNDEVIKFRVEVSGPALPFGL